MRKIARWTTALLCVAAGTLLPIPPAQAASIGLVCAVGSQTATYSPPMTNTTHVSTVRIRENYSCASLLTGISSGQGTASFLEDTSCLLTVQPAVADVITYRWNTGKSSVITFNRTSVARALNGTTTITSVGSVTSGPGQGSAATRVVALPAPNLVACSTFGVSSQTGPATLVIL